MIRFAGEVFKMRQAVPVIMHRRAFTLPQLLLVLSVVSILAAVSLSVFTRSRAMARRSTCDMQLKTLTVALDAFREETGRYPEHLDELLAKKYLTDPAMLKCPADPRPGGSYDDYYVMRAARDSGELPILCCPICSNTGNGGIQAFKGRYTKQFAIRPAQISEAVGVTIERPGKDTFDARSGMALQSGDIIRTIDGGSATVNFVDGSRCNMGGSSEITILQSFIAGQTYAPLYTLIRQAAGDVAYHVHRGSKFDVSTPTATAGALGTAFRVKQDSTKQWWLKVSESKVLVSDLGGRDIVMAEGETMPPPADSDIPVSATSEWTFLGQLEDNTASVSMMGMMAVSRSAVKSTRTKIKVLRHDWYKNRSS